MKTNCLTTLFSWLLLICVSPVVSHPTAAQENRPDDPPPLNEQTIYIPYDKLREVFERDGRGVFLPYEKFQQLWAEARANQPRKPATGPPLGSLITDIESIATLGKDIVNVDATIEIELLKEGWHRLPLRLTDAAIGRASIDDKPARVVANDDGQYELIVSHDSNEPKTIQLKLSYAKSLTKSGGQSSVAFASPQAPVNRWIIRTGQKDIDVLIEPMIASSKKTNDDEDATDDSNGSAIPGDEILAFVGAAPEVKISWTPKTEGATGLAALVAAQTSSQFQIDQGVARTSATIQLDISRAEINAVSVTVPADQKVVNLYDRNVKKWEVKQPSAEDNKNHTQTIVVELFEPALGQQSLELELESFIEKIDGTSLTVPTIAVNDVSRNSGLVVVKFSTDLQAEIETKTGLLQIDAAELTGKLRKQKWDYAYRYAALPFELALKLKKVQPLINVDQWVDIAVRPDQLNLQLSLVYDIQLSGVFQLSLDIPAEFQVREIVPLSRDGLANIPVDTFYRDADNQDRVLVTLSKKALGKFGLLVSLDRELDDANLLTPTETPAQLKITIPQASIDSTEFSQGHAIVYSPESLQVNADETKGLRNESFENALQHHAAKLAADDLVPRLAFGFSHTAAELELAVKRRRPQVTVEQVIVITVQSGVVNYDARLFYDTLYSGLKSLRLDVPTDLVGDLRIQTSNILHQTMQPQPNNIPVGFTAWELTGDAEFFGKREIRLTWEEKIPNLPLGQSLNLQVHRLIPAEVDRSSGQIVLTKSETIDVRPESDSTGLRPIDPQTDLTHGVKVNNSALAFEFVDDWRLKLTATRFELQDLKTTSISRAVIRTVALRQNELSVQCLYQMRSVGQRISLQMPAGFDAATSFDDQPIRVNGRRVTPERGGKDLIYIPLTGQVSDTPFLLEVRYTIAGSPHQIELPVFADEPAVQKVFLCVYLPHEQALLHQSGPWTDEAIDENGKTIARLLNTGTANSMFDRMFRLRNENVDSLVNWVSEGIGDSSTANQKFEVDGRPYVFSALRPDPPPAGSLHLQTINMKLLNVIVCGMMALVGLMLIRSRLTIQIAGALLLLALLVFTGVFFPLVTEHLFGEALLLTAGLIGLVWLVFDVRRWLIDFAADRREYRLHRLQPVTDAGLVSDEDVQQAPRTRTLTRSISDEDEDGNGGGQ